MSSHCWQTNIVATGCKLGNHKISSTILWQGSKHLTNSEKTPYINWLNGSNLKASLSFLPCMRFKVLCVSLYFLHIIYTSAFLLSVFYSPFFSEKNFSSVIWSPVFLLALITSRIAFRFVKDLFTFINLIKLCCTIFYIVSMTLAWRDK